MLFVLLNKEKVLIIMTQLEAARKGIITQQMEEAAKLEGMSGEELRQKIAAGEAVLPGNVNHKDITPIAVGERSVD